MLTGPKIVAALQLQHFMKVANQRNSSTTTHQVPVSPFQVAQSQMPSVNLQTESQGLAHISGYNQVGRERVPTLRL